VLLLFTILAAAWRNRMGAVYKTQVIKFLVCRREKMLVFTAGSASRQCAHRLPHLVHLSTCEPSLSARTHHIASQPLAAAAFLWGDMSDGELPAYTMFPTRIIRWSAAWGF